MVRLGSSSYSLDFPRPRSWRTALGFLVKRLVTYRTKRDEIMLGIISQSQAAPWVKVMHLQIHETSTALTPPPISLQHLLAQLFV